MESAKSNLFFLCVARIDEESARSFVVASRSFNNSQISLDGVKQVLQQPNVVITPGKHYSFETEHTGWHLRVGEKIQYFVVLQSFIDLY